jgi:hypothetical protein
MRIQICSMHIDNAPEATSTKIFSNWLIQGEEFYWLIPSLAHFLLL